MVCSSYLLSSLFTIYFFQGWHFLFILHQNTDIIFLLVYVDDIILTGSNAALIQQVIHSLEHEFSIRDLGALHYFLGIELQ